MEGQNERHPVEDLIQVTLAGNVVLLDPMTCKEYFFTANEAHDRFTNADGESFTMEQLYGAMIDRFQMAIEEQQKKGAQSAPTTGTPAAAPAPARYCNYCGKPLVAGDRFCRHCGKPIG